jgi:AraC-like DNA-binding protein
VEEHCDDERRFLQVGMIVCRRGPFDHDLRFAANNTVIVHVEPGDRFDRHVPEECLSASAETRLLASRLRSDLRLQSETRSLSIRSTVLRLIAWLSRAATEREESLAQRAQRYVQMHYMSRIALSDVARELRADPVHLAHAYRRAYGTSVGEAIRLHRLCRAAELLSDDRASLAAVARASGFYDASHLTRAWTAAHGQPPSAFSRAS